MYIRNIHKPIRIFIALLGLCLPVLTGCANQGDLGRSSPSLLAKTYVSGLNRARHLLGEEEDYDLPLTAAEDALRVRHDDLLALRLAGVVGRVIRAHRGDGFAHVEALIEDLRVDHQQFLAFVTAARKVMRIDEARHRRLADLDALGARRQLLRVRQRRATNDGLIREGVRAMRLRSQAYERLLRDLPLEWPNVPLDELRDAYEKFHEDVVLFHGEIDRRAYEKLGQSDHISYK